MLYFFTWAIPSISGFCPPKEKRTFIKNIHQDVKLQEKVKINQCNLTYFKGFIFVAALHCRFFSLSPTAQD